MTRVLMTGDALGGVWTHALALAEGLCGTGLEVHLATMGRLPDVDQRRRAQRIPGLRLHPSEYRLCWMRDPWDDVAAAGAWLAGLAAEIRPDVVHLNDYGHAAMDWPGPVLVAGHSCVVSWWHAVHGEAPPPAWSRYARLVGEGLRRADLVVAPTRAMAEALRTLYGLARPVRVIPNGLPRPRGEPAQPVKEPLVFSAGRLWDEAKNLSTLAGIAGDLPWPVVVAGSGGDAGAAPALRFTGRLAAPELGRWYARASIFALPARYEPFGLAALEAAQRGCALVLGDLPSQREVWGDAARYVPPGDAGVLRDTILGLIHDPRLRQRQRRRALRRAAELGAGPMTAAYLAAYHQLPGRRPACRSA